MIRFDSVRAINDLKKAIRLALVELRKEVLADAEGRMLTPEGRADIEAGPIEEVTEMITVLIIEGPWAVMDEMGKGSLLDSSNPFLEAYKNSPLWNPVRKDHVVRGRPAGSYKNIFGETAHSTGRAEGRNLERIGDITGNPYFMPHPPSHALQTAMRWMANGRFQTVIGQLIQAFPWGRYLIVGGK